MFEIVCAGSARWYERPGARSGKPDTIEVQFVMTQMNQVDELLGQVTVGGYFRTYWTDTRLACIVSILVWKGSKDTFIRLCSRMTKYKRGPVNNMLVVNDTTAAANVQSHSSLKLAR